MEPTGPHSHRFWSGASPWIVIGAIVVLVPMVAFLSMQNINRQKANNTRLMVEKGAALIRSFEAGTRFGMLGMHRRGFQLQRLLFETAQQPDIDYLLVVDADGRILAHSDPARIGALHGDALDMQQVARSTELRWRLRRNSAGERVFEIFRRFSPTGEPMGMHRGFMMMPNRPTPAPTGTPGDGPLDMAIFIGLKMDALEAARQADTRHTLVMAAILLLVGFAGVVLLLLTQNYQATRKALARIQAFSDNLVTHMPIGLLAIDDRDKIVAVNPAAATLLNLPPDGLVGTDSRVLLPPALLAQRDALGTGTPLLAREIDCPLKTCRTLPLQVSASVLTDGHGTLLGHLLLFTDLSEVHRLRQRIARDQRLVTVGKLAGGVAHEIRNPLSSIKGFATYFKEQYQEAPGDRKIADIMIQEIERLDRVVGQLLEFSRPVEIAAQTTPLGPFIDDSVQLVARQAADSGIDIVTRIADGLDTARFDPGRLRQVLLNLYLNALAAMEQGGTLTVSVDPAPSAAGLQIRVADTGEGIADDDLAHVFDPYFTTKPSGTGLGLAIVHNIVEAHKGEIRITSQRGQGTVATLFLPDTGASQRP